MQFQGFGKPPHGIIFDSDMGERVDTALALAVLYGLDGKNETRVVALSVSKSNLNSAALCEVIGRFYAGAVSGAFAAVGRSLPTGMADDGKLKDDTPMLQGALNRKIKDGAPAYAHNIHRILDTAEVPALLRNALTSQYDDNCSVVVAGRLTNLASAMKLPDFSDWAKKKARRLVISAGSFDGPSDPRIAIDVASARKVLAEWPGEIVVVGSELGAQLPFPGASIDKDFAWSEAHPVVDAYRAYKPMPYDAPTSDVAAILFAVREKEKYFTLSEQGNITIADDGRMTFQAAGSGKHRRLQFDAAQKDRIIQAYVELASAKPVPRVPRFRQQKKDAAAPTKPEDKKP